MQVEAEGAALLPRFSPILFFFPTSIFQVYVSYDYGRSFKRISDKLNFGEGNSSEAVIAQFYHSPADNRRVRTSPVVDCVGLSFGTMAVLQEGWEMQRLGVFAA